MDNFHTGEDYYTRVILTSTLRLVRLIGLFTSGYIARSGSRRDYIQSGNDALGVFKLADRCGPKKHPCLRRPKYFF